MAASHDQSKRESSTTSTATQTNIAASEQSQTNAQVTTGNRNNIGTTETRFGNNANVHVESIDGDTIQGAFGLTTEVVNRLSELATGYVDRSSQESERNTAAVANAFEQLGAQLSTATERQIDAFTPDGGKDKMILAAIVVAGILGAIALFRGVKRP